MKLVTTAIALTTLAGIASAGDPAKGAPATPAKDSAKQAPPPAAEMPMAKPPQELLDMGKATAGTWKCTGNVYMDIKDPTKGTPAAGSITMKLDLNNWWVASSFAGSGKLTLKFEMFTTYDAAKKQWYRFAADNMGGRRIATSAGPKDGKIVWEGDAISAMGSAKLRETEEPTKDSLHTVGEISMDGKTWLKTHDVTCKK
jgi:hypothetical protein